MSHLPADAHRRIQPETCSCFPGTCRGGDVVEGKLASGAHCKRTRPLQARIREWCVACFGEGIADDAVERQHRFLEEALELVQSLGCTIGEAIHLVGYVFDRPPGEPRQEVGGVVLTLSALCSVWGIDVLSAGEEELARVWTRIEQIRAKQAAKPRNSPLPATARFTPLVQFIDGLLASLGREPTEGELRAAAHALTVRADRIACAAAAARTHEEA